MTSEEQQRMDEQMMRLALKEAERAYEEGEVPVGAVVVCEGRVIARAHNQTERLGDVTAHAEMLAITSAANLLGGKYLTNCTLYVSVDPCGICIRDQGWAQVGRVVYGATDEKRGYHLFAPQAMHVRTEVVAGVLEEECAELMKSFFQRLR